MLRPYQDEAQLKVRVLLKTHKRVILCLQTGGGKTVIARHLMGRVKKKDLRMAFLCDREEILSQALKELLKEGISTQIVDSTTKGILQAQCYLGMAETFYRRLVKGLIPKLDVVIVDEAHEGIFFKILDELEKNYNPYVIGLTATPVSSEGTHALNKYYGEIVTSLSTGELIEQGYLCPAVEFGHNELLQFNVKAGEFSSESQVHAFSEAGLAEKMMRCWLDRAADRKTICYNIDIDHNKEIFKKFNDHGIAVCMVDSKMPKDERRSNITMYKKGLYQVLCNVGIATKGFDDPETSCIVANFSTTSIRKWRQAIGRGCRPFKDKKDFIIIDMGNNILRHGSFDDDIDWRMLFFDEKRAKNFSVRKTHKLCPVCYAYYSYKKFLSVCEVCNNNFKVNPMIFPVDAMPLDLQGANIQTLNLKDLNRYGKAMGYKPGWAYHQHMKNIGQSRW